MGGGGDGGSRSIGDIQQLVERAKNELRKAETASKRNVFISFAYDDIGAVNLLRGQARNENSDIEFNDWSVSTPINSERAPYIKNKITERINQCSVTVVYLSPLTARSDWVAWEIEESRRLGKHVVGVYPKGGRPEKLPSLIKKHKIRCVPWPDLAATIAALK